MNIAVIFAGGVGQRMHKNDIPKQFLIAKDAPIIVHTLRAFEKHPDVDGIIIACLKEWIPHMEELIQSYGLSKVDKVIPGGPTGQMSIYYGLQAAAETYGTEDVVVLIHDGVRPLIDQKTITDNILSVRIHGSAITCVPSQETFLLTDHEKIIEIPPRRKSWVAKAPQSFWLEDVLRVEEKAVAEGYMNVIDTCTLMRIYEQPLYLVHGSENNIKITTQKDFFLFQALYETVKI